MAYPTLHITNGPGQRDLEQAFLARNLGAVVKFTVSNGNQPTIVGLKILNFSFVTCHGLMYELGGLLTDAENKELPTHNFIFVHYNLEARTGKMEFSNAE